MDLSKLTTKELETPLKRLPKEISKRKQQEEAKLVEHITQIASERGYTLKELIGKAVPAVKPGKSRRRKPVAVKYRLPVKANLTWTGRGRKPLWVTEGSHEGKTMETLAV